MVTYRMSKQAIAYIRVSTDSQRDEGIGLEAQRASIRAYADASGVEIIEWFQDVASGRGEKNLALREDLKKALDFAEENKVDLLVDGLDRLSRHKKTVEHIMRERKVAIVSVSDERTKDPLVLAMAEAILESDRSRNTLIRIVSVVRRCWPSTTSASGFCGSLMRTILPKK